MDTLWVVDMPIQKQSIPPKLLDWIERWLSKKQLSKDSVTVEPLVGDGSTRSFFRLTLPKKTRIIMFDPNWTFSQNYAAHQAFLKENNITVPEFYEIDPSAGCLLMEDCGNELLQDRIQNVQKEKLDWLKKAAQILGHLHGSTHPTPKSIPGARQLFDQEKFSSELFFTEEHLVKNFLNLDGFSKEEHDGILAFCTHLSQIKPLVFCHRDYHTRNLLVHRRKLYLIDFQDARMGPPQYDLASLIFDAYIPLSKEERDDLTNLYLETVTPYPLYKEINVEQFGKDLNAVALQRTLKAAGSFASFYTRFGKTTHLEYLIPCLQNAEMLSQRVDTLTDSMRSAFQINRWIEKIEQLRSQNWPTPKLKIPP